MTEDLSTPKGNKKTAFSLDEPERKDSKLISNSDPRESHVGGAVERQGSSNNIRHSARTTARPTVRQSVRDADLQKKAARKAATPAYIVCCRTVVNHKAFIGLTTLLTVYALLGDDVRLLYTEKPADDVFNGITIMCMVIFTFEVILSCIGKEDYLNSFFFHLDIISTTTMALDLTWVNDLIYGDDENLENLQGSRTAKLGARTARVVRVLRLVRIIKLYKAVYEAKQARKKQLERLAMMREGRRPGQEDDDDWENAEGDPDMKVDTLARGESRVGKRLSDKTTRKVIILVLSMMLALPLLKVDDHAQLPFSPVYGADAVYAAYTKWQLSKQNVTNANRTTYLHEEFSRQLLQVIYYHNWYTGNAESCPIEDNICSRIYFNYIFWVGIITQNTGDYVTLERQANDFKILANVADKFANDVAKEENIYNFGEFPTQVQVTLKSDWTQKCDGSKVSRLGFSLIKESMDASGGLPAVTYEAPCPEDLRRNSRGKYAALTMTEDDAAAWHIGFYVDKRNFVRNESLFSLITTFFVCFVLCVASLMFSNDADKLVLNPVEIMISKVERIRDNPLMAMKMSDDDFRQEELKKQREKLQEQDTNKLRKIRDYILCNHQKDNEQEPMETVILEKTIIKIGSLLALGFGEAGANIIEHNMSGVDSAMVTAMVEGTRVECIIGCTRIRDFSIATEVLQGNVINFVNQIAEVVHGIVDELHGAANKNNGEHFLLIWRTSELDDGMVSKLADMSMLAFTRILGAVHRSPALAVYRTHPGLQKRLKGNTRVNLSFSLHYGWAIEGAVGSEFKIDASYLSPNVSIAESLEGATQIYGVSVLVSELVINMCSPQMAAKCRLIDRVILTGSPTAMELYCIDLDYCSLNVEPALHPVPPWNPRQRFRCRQFLEQEKTLKWSDDVAIVSFFNMNPHIATMRFRYTLEFTHVFNMGFQNYSEGEWQVAKRFLSLTKTMLGTEDGPSAALLRFMEYPYAFEKPDSWKGIRDLGDVLGL